MRYSHDSWSIELPSGWQVEEEVDVVSFFHPEGVGSFEVSTFLSDDGNVTEEDLLGIAEASAPKPVTLPYLAGFFAVEEEEGETIFQWWLATDNQLIYATYACEVGQEDIESAERTQMIESLRSFYADIEG